MASEVGCVRHTLLDSFRLFRRRNLLEFLNQSADLAAVRSPLFGLDVLPRSVSSEPIVPAVALGRSRMERFHLLPDLRVEILFRFRLVAAVALDERPGFQLPGKFQLGPERMRVGNVEMALFVVHSDMAAGQGWTNIMNPLVFAGLVAVAVTGLGPGRRQNAPPAS